MEGLGQPHQIRGPQPAQNNTPQTPQPQVSTPPNNTDKWYHPTLESKIVVILMAVAALVVLLAFATGVFSSQDTVPNSVKKDQYQAVFLTNGQVYFGKITHMDRDTVVLADIYYLQVDQQLQPEQQADGTSQPQVSLAKLGSELHGPEDEMFISAREVIFWENLKNDGDVVQAILTFRENNTNGGSGLGQDEAAPALSEDDDSTDEDNEEATP